MRGSKPSVRASDSHADQDHVFQRRGSPLSIRLIHTFAGLRRTSEGERESWEFGLVAVRC